MPPPELLSQYAALTSEAGFADLGARTQLEFTGADRASFLHNLCTNEVKKLTPGGGCEAFITNVQGRTIGHGYIFCRADSLVFDTVPGQGEFLFEHFDKYHVREKVEIHDRTQQWGEILLAGPRAAAILTTLTRSASEDSTLTRSVSEDSSGSISNWDSILAETPVSIRRLSFVGPDSFFLTMDLTARENVASALRQAGAIECSPEAVEMARVEAGTPLFGRDITDKNLPQEVARDARAISFTKGCYLGQETVARIDALGHVNQVLCGVRCEGNKLPPPDAPLFSGDKQVGQVTSAAWSPRLNGPLCLAYLRREFTKAGTEVRSKDGAAVVAGLPILQDVK